MAYLCSAFAVLSVLAVTSYRFPYGQYHMKKPSQKVETKDHPCPFVVMSKYPLGETPTLDHVRNLIARGSPSPSLSVDKSL